MQEVARAATKSVTLDLPADRIDELDAIADELGISRSALIRWAVRLFLESRPFHGIVAEMGSHERPASRA